jgi:hypothetical protein
MKAAIRDLRLKIQKMKVKKKEVKKVPSKEMSKEISGGNVL